MVQRFYQVQKQGNLMTLGYDVAGATQKVHIAAAGEMLQVPRMVVRRFNYGVWF
jgi:hypothetical protein